MPAATISELSCSAYAEHPVIANAGVVSKHRWLLGRPPSRTMTAESHHVVPWVLFGALHDLPDPLHHGRRGLVDLLDQRLDLGSARDLEIELALLRVGAELGIAHGVLEPIAQDFDDLVRNARRRDEGPAELGIAEGKI